MASGTIDRDGFLLRYLREGSGPPVLSLGAVSFYPRWYPAALRAHVELVSCDLRQWAPTPNGFDVSTITRDTFTDDIDAIRRELGLERPIVMGHSQHGTMALEYARRHPDRVAGVVAVGAPPPGWADDDAAIEAFFAADASPERKAAHARNHAARPLPDPIVTSADFATLCIRDDALSWHDPTADGAPLWEGVEGNLDVLARIWAPEAFGGFRLDALDVPVLLVLGRHDYVVPFTLWEAPRRALRRATYRLYARSGHHPPYEEPDAFTADVAAWAAGL